MHPSDMLQMIPEKKKKHKSADNNEINRFHFKIINIRINVQIKPARIQRIYYNTFRRV